MEQKMQSHTVVSPREWIAARKALLAKEKAFTRQRDELSKARRELPWEQVEKEYLFDGPDGKETLAQLFENRHQLIVYHFMFDPAWENGCKSCSFWVDNIDPNVVHLKHRDITPVVVSRAPPAKLAAFRERMGWHFKWVSSFGSDFNYDYHVSFTPESIANGNVTYNYCPCPQTGTMLERPGISVFFKDDSGLVFHTYSCYARGLDMMNVAYHYLDLVPKGRDEACSPQAWVRYHDSYEDGVR
jgi:predicted dithiol-disulfide oxidoreductase (DUF899 family)